MESTLTATGLTLSIECLIEEREVAGSIPGVGPILKVLKKLRSEDRLDLRVAQMTT